MQKQLYFDIEMKTALRGVFLAWPGSKQKVQMMGWIERLGG